MLTACICAKSLQSCRTLVSPWTVACQVPLSMGFSRQEYWSGLPCPPPGDLPNPETKPTDVTCPVLADVFFPTSATCCCRQVASVVSDSVRPHRRQPTRLPRPWDSPGKNTGVGLPFPSPMHESEVAQSCPTLYDPIDGSPPGSPVPGILQARTLEIPA